MPYFGFTMVVKFWAENPVFVHVMRKSCNKTLFILFYDMYSLARFFQVSGSFAMKMLQELELLVF